MYLTPKILLFLSVQFEKYKIELAVEEIKSSEPVLWKPGRYYDKYHRVGSFLKDLAEKEDILQLDGIMESIVI